MHDRVCRINCKSKILAGVFSFFNNLLLLSFPLFMLYLFSEDGPNSKKQNSGQLLDPWWIALICLIAILLIVFIVIVMCTMNKDEESPDLKSQYAREFGDA